MVGTTRTRAGTRSCESYGCRVRQFFDMASPPGAWERPTACPEWQVRDVVGHLVVTTESYRGVRRSTRSRSGVRGLRSSGMASASTRRPLSLRDVHRRSSSSEPGPTTRSSPILDGLSEQDWTGLVVPHFYMGPLPAFFYPAFQLMDYGVHLGHQGRAPVEPMACPATSPTSSCRSCSSQATAAAWDGAEPSEPGVRITTGANAGDTMRPGPRACPTRAGTHRRCRR